MRSLETTSVVPPNSPSPHRLRRTPFDDQRGLQRLHDALDRIDPPNNDEPQSDARASEPPADASPAAESSDLPRGESPTESTGQPGDLSEPSSPHDGDAPTSTPDQRAEVGPPLPLPPLDLDRDRFARPTSGRRQPSFADDGRGRIVRAAVPEGPTSDIALVATVRAAASHPPAPDSTLAVSVEPSDLRRNVRRASGGVAILLVVDASGSMGARRRMEAAKGAALTLLTDAYQRRDRVGLIAFRAKGAELLLPFTDSVETAHAQLRELPTGGRTPLAAGLQAALDVVRQHRLKDPAAPVLVVLITDGKANVPLYADSPIDEALTLAAHFAQPGLTTLVLDTENDPLSFGLARRLADAAGARYVRLAEISAEAVTRSVHALR
ncbi:MAG: hypothetical protein KatS3mg060_0353 [Dehalococcoidia bacterium]|nr:MAG: hypothetical protein KatS3mg060_0353 [Dehalococcoidia bacterium]